jgi:hypothetical protein
MSSLAIVALHMNLVVNEVSMDMQLLTVANVKMSPQMQWATSSATFQKP